MNVSLRPSPRGLILAAGCALLFACGDDATPATTSDTVASADTLAAADTDTPADDTLADAATEDTAAADTTAPLCTFSEPPCSDEQIAALRFDDTPSGGAITEEGSTAGEFHTHIDATAGGFNGTLGYTYARFTEAGLEAVALADEDSLESMDWDIAFRRYIIRLNSGVSGPSCVLGGRTGAATVWADLHAVPDTIVMREEQYFIGDACEYVPETSGIGSPLTILSSFWSYGGCVAMTGNIYVIALRDGRHVKLQVTSYYDLDAQKTCDRDDTVPTPNGSGNLRIRWAYLD